MPSVVDEFAKTTESFRKLFESPSVVDEFAKTTESFRKLFELIDTTVSPADEEPAGGAELIASAHQMDASALADTHAVLTQLAGLAVILAALAAAGLQESLLTAYSVVSLAATAVGYLDRTSDEIHGYFLLLGIALTVILSRRSH